MTEATRQGEELAYALITPYSLHKSRTGGILARLLWGNVKLVAARMYAPRAGSGFIEDYCNAIYDPDERCIELRYQKLLIEYIVRNFGKPNVRGISNRLALLIFRGPDAVREIAEAVGHISRGVQGDTVRGTFGSFFQEGDEPQDSLAYRERKRLLDKYEALSGVEIESPRNEFFEPAVLTGASPELTQSHLRIFRRHAYSDGGLVMDALDALDPETVETSTVVLKPESFRSRNPLPGNMIDFFSRAGMYITAMKMIELSVEEAREFYALKIPQFRRQLKDMVARRARRILDEAKALAREAENLGADPERAAQPAEILAGVRRMEDLLGRDARPGEAKPRVVERIFNELAQRLEDLDPPDSLYDELAEDLKDANARAEFDELIRYMTGRNPATGAAENPGEETRCMALLYSGPGALSVIRKRLKELREVYGQDILKNRAHASDPEEEPAREMSVLGMPTTHESESRPCDVVRVIDQSCGPPEPEDEPL